MSILLKTEKTDAVNTGLVEKADKSAKALKGDLYSVGKKGTHGAGSTALDAIARKRKKTSAADALDGKTGIVKEEIKTGGYGYVGIDGDMWRSISESGEAIPAGTKVVVISHESIILTVKPAEA